MLRRLEGVFLEYREAGGTEGDWAPALNSSSLQIDFVPLESSYGYASVDWPVVAILGGAYELRARAQCRGSALSQATPPPGMDSAVTKTIPGLIDRLPPKQFGPARPVGNYVPGSAIAVDFSELVLCSRPYRFQVALAIEGIAQEFNKDNLVVVCEGRTIAISFDLAGELQLSSFSGRKATMTVTNVLDLANNPTEIPVLNTFTFAPNVVGNRDERITWLTGVPPTGGSRRRSWAGHAQNFERAAALLLSVNPDRVKFERLPGPGSPAAASMVFQVIFRPQVNGAASRSDRPALDLAAALFFWATGGAVPGAYEREVSAIDRRASDGSVPTEFAPYVKALKWLSSHPGVWRAMQLMSKPVGPEGQGAVSVLPSSSAMPTITSGGNGSPDRTVDKGSGVDGSSKVNVGGSSGSDNDTADLYFGLLLTCGVLMIVMLAATAFCALKLQKGQLRSEQQLQKLISAQTSLQSVRQVQVPSSPVAVRYTDPARLRSAFIPPGPAQLGEVVYAWDERGAPATRSFAISRATGL